MGSCPGPSLGWCWPQKLATFPGWETFTASLSGMLSECLLAPRHQGSSMPSRHPASYIQLQHRAGSGPRWHHSLQPQQAI